MTRFSLMALCLFSLTACTPQTAFQDANPVSLGLANPASVHCAQQGGRSAIRSRADGAQYGVCVFNDGRQCEEWALLRDKRCVAPGQVID